MNDGPPTDEEWTYIEGYGEDYAITAAGEVWSSKRGRWELKCSWENNEAPTVELYRNGNRTRRRVSVLVSKHFGADEGDAADVDDDELRWYLSEQYGLEGEELDELIAGDVATASGPAST